MPSSRAISAIGRPLVRTSSTASRLNSAVNWRRFLRCLSSMRTSSAQGRCPASGGKSRTPGWPLQALILGGVAGWLGVVMYGVVRYPAMGAFNLWGALAFTGLLAGYVGMALLPPRFVTGQVAAARGPALVG